MADEIAQPVTLGDLAREGRLLWCYCWSCSYEREVEPLSLGIDPAEPVPTVGKRLKCSRCGSRDVPFSDPHAAGLSLSLIKPLSKRPKANSIDWT